MASKPKFTVHLECKSNGRLGLTDVIVRRKDGSTAASDYANLRRAAERKKVAKDLAPKAGVEAAWLLDQIETKWCGIQDEHQRLRELAASGSAEAAAEVSVELLDSTPLAIRRPLCLVDGQAYAAAWVPVQTTTKRSVDQAGAVTEHQPPLVHVGERLLVVAEDGQLYAEGGVPGARPLAALGLPVHLSAPLPPGRGWSGAGLKRYLAGDRPDSAEVFGRLTSVFDRFIDFARSLASQETMCELVACYALATYLLDAFHVVGYLWPNGERGTGKTSLLQVVVETSYLGQLILAGSSYACLRDLADYGATLAFDDAEAVMDLRRTDPDKRTLLLAGNRRGATVAVKELEGERWVTRHVSTFCPRLFSAIRLPDEVLGSRSVIIPLVRSGDPRRAKASVYDRAAWPCDQRRLIDDLWALGLANLHELPEHDRAAAGATQLAGRDLDRWRPVLAVAHWLQECHGEDGLFDRMEELAVAYQREGGEYEDGSPIRVLLRALDRLTREQADVHRTVLLSPAQIAGEMNAVAKAEDLADGDKDFTTARKVGWLMKRQRFQRGASAKQGKQWRISREEILGACSAYGIDLDSRPDDSAGEAPF